MQRKDDFYVGIFLHEGHRTKYEDDINNRTSIYHHMNWGRLYKKKGLSTPNRLPIIVPQYRTVSEKEGAKA